MSVQLQPVIAPSAGVKCAECGEPVAGLCAFDPDGSRGAKSVVHLGCANTVADRLEAELLRLADAAPDMLAVLKKVEVATRCGRAVTVAEFGTIGQKCRKLRSEILAAIKKARG